MDRTRVVLFVVVVSACAGAASLSAQTAASAEGWVVLPVNEYRVAARTARCRPRRRPRRLLSTPRCRKSTTTCALMATRWPDARC